MFHILHRISILVFTYGFTIFSRQHSFKEKSRIRVKKLLLILHSY